MGTTLTILGTFTTAEGTTITAEAGKFGASSKEMLRVTIRNGGAVAYVFQAPGEKAFTTCRTGLSFGSRKWAKIGSAVHRVKTEVERLAALDARIAARPMAVAS